jgi:hypothetical protein
MDPTTQAKSLLKLADASTSGTFLLRSTNSKVQDTCAFETKILTAARRPNPRFSRQSEKPGKRLVSEKRVRRCVRTVPKSVSSRADQIVYV